jgi:hypothetical protein
MEKIEQGLALEELEAQFAELLPDRLEMHRRRRNRGGRNVHRHVNRGFECSPTNVQVGDDFNDIDQDVQCFRVNT